LEIENVGDIWNSDSNIQNKQTTKRVSICVQSYRFGVRYDKNRSKLVGFKEQKSCNFKKP